MDWGRVVYNVIRVYFAVLILTATHMTLVVLSPHPTSNQVIVLWSAIVVLGFVGSVTAGYFRTRWANW